MMISPEGYVDDLKNEVTVKSEYVIDLANKTPTSKERIKELIEDSLIHNEIMGSDHCPISLIIKI